MVVILAVQQAEFLSQVVVELPMKACCGLQRVPSRLVSFFIVQATCFHPKRCCYPLSEVFRGARSRLALSSSSLLFCYDVGRGENVPDFLPISCLTSYSSLLSLLSQQFLSKCRALMVLKPFG